MEKFENLRLTALLHFTITFINKRKVIRRRNSYRSFGIDVIAIDNPRDRQITTIGKCFLKFLLNISLELLTATNVDLIPIIIDIIERINKVK